MYKHLSTLINTGQPITRCIADTVTEAIVQAFLKTISDRSPHTTVRVIMTDDGKKPKWIDV